MNFYAQAHVSQNYKKCELKDVPSEVRTYIDRARKSLLFDALHNVSFSLLTVTAMVMTSWTLYALYLKLVVMMQGSRTTFIALCILAGVLFLTRILPDFIYYARSSVICLSSRKAMKDSIRKVVVNFPEDNLHYPEITDPETECPAIVIDDQPYEVTEDSIRRIIEAKGKNVTVYLYTFFGTHKAFAEKEGSNA